MRQLFKYDRTIGYQFVPGLRARVLHESGGYFIRVNALGFRSNREYIPEKRIGTRRILLFGDSFTAGDGVPNEKRYSDLLETASQELEVYNFGIPGSGTDQQYLCYKEFAAGIEHDLLIIAVLVDNIGRVKRTYRPYIDESGMFTAYAKPYYELVEGQLVLRNVPVPRLPMKESALSPELSEALRFMKHHGRGGAVQQLIAEYADPDNPSWWVMRAILERWIREHPKPVLLVPIPLYQFVEESCDPTPYVTRFREVCQATRCFFHDPLPDLQRYTLEERRGFRFVRDIHPTPAGHAALAKSLEPAIMQAMS